jgi:hypothetical protein
MIGRQLGRQVGQVVVHGARWILARQQQFAHCLPARLAGLDEQKIADEHSFFCQRARKRRQRPRATAADFGVMSPAGRKESQLASLGIEHRRDDRHIGQVRTAAVRVVGHHHVAGAQVRTIGQHGAHGFSHRSQVDRNVRRVHHQVAGRREERATEIKPLLHVHAARRVAQRNAHLLGNGSELAVEDFQPYWIGDCRIGNRW